MNYADQIAPAFDTPLFNKTNSLSSGAKVVKYHLHQRQDNIEQKLSTLNIIILN